MDRQRLFLEFIDYLFVGISKREYRKTALSVKWTKRFIDSDYPITYRGCLRFVKDHISEIALEVGAKDSLYDFIRFAGGGKKERRTKEVKPLEKLSDMSEKNKKIIDDFIYYLTQEEDYSQSTLNMYMESAKQFFQYANEVSADNYKRFVKTLEEKGFSPETICLRITGLERLSKFLNKPIKLKRPKYQRKLDTNNIPNEKEYEKLLEYLLTKKNKDYYFFIRILATTGARVSEFLQFTWENILDGEVTLRGKGNKYRRFFFNKKLQHEVKEYIKETGKTGYVAMGKYGILSSRGFAMMMKDWGEGCGIERSKMHPHAFRHFFAKMYLKKNKDLIQLADLMGHESIDTTRIYLQKSYDEQKKEFNRGVTW